MVGRHGDLAFETIYIVGSGGLAHGRCAVTMIHKIPRCIDGSYNMTVIRHSMVRNIAIATATSTSLKLELLWAPILPDAALAASAAAAFAAAGAAGIAAL